MSVTPLPCIVCGMQPEPIWDDGYHPWQPHRATMFDCGPGNYGSTVWDEFSSDRSLTINVCDKCLVERKDRVAVVETIPREPETTFTNWEGPYSPTC